MAEVLSEILGDQGTRKMPASRGKTSHGSKQVAHSRSSNTGGTVALDETVPGWHLDFTPIRTAQDRPCDPTWRTMQASFFEAIHQPPIWGAFSWALRYGVHAEDARLGVNHPLPKETPHDAIRLARHRPRPVHGRRVPVHLRADRASRPPEPPAAPGPRA